jgi:polyketide cyclase/dehydrase/lipid transport protein
VIHPVFGLALTAGMAAWVWWALSPAGRAIQTHVSVDIRCEPSTAFAVVGDPRRAASLVDGFEVDAPLNQEPGVGYRYHCRYRYRPESKYVFDFDEEVVEYRPGRIKVRVDGGRATGTCVVELSPGGTRVIYDFESMITPEQALLGLRKKVKSRAVEIRERAWKRLKELLEAPSDSLSDEPVT